MTPTWWLALLITLGQAKCRLIESDAPWLDSSWSCMKDFEVPDRILWIKAMEEWRRQRAINTSESPNTPITPILDHHGERIQSNPKLHNLKKLLINPYSNSTRSTPSFQIIPVINRRNAPDLAIEFHELFLILPLASKISIIIKIR